MNNHNPILLLFVMLAPVAVGQKLIDRNKVEFSGLTHSEGTRRIFEGEREMIAGLKDLHPVVETYLQSLWPGTKAQSPIDDAYMLTSVDFGRASKPSGKGRRGYQKFIFGGDSSKVRVNNGRKWQLNPNGYLDMLFVDIEDFNAETYRLTYLKQAPLGNTQVLLFSVDPHAADDPGRFKGQLWVDKSTLKIIRIKGTFSSGRISRRKRILGGNIPLYLSFDSWREEVKPGVWLPRYTYFDEDRPSGSSHANLEISFHWRGQTFIWGYSDNEKEVDENAASAPDRLSTLEWLEHRKLLAKSGTVEQQLNLMVSQILVNNKLSVPSLSCRVLITIPIEMFNVGHTIIISRGLLNILPSDAALSLLLAHQVAEAVLGLSDIGFQSDVDVPSSATAAKHRIELRSPLDIDTDAWKLAASFVAVAGTDNSVADTMTLINQLSGSVHQVPSLLRPRFGRSLADFGKSLSRLEPSRSSQTIRRPLILRGNYVIDAWSDTLEPTGITSGLASQVPTDSVPGVTH